MLAVSIVIQLAFQHGLSRVFFLSDNILVRNIPYLPNAWVSDCETRWLENNATTTFLEDDEAMDLTESCVANQAHYRVAFATTVFFVLAATAAICFPPANRVAWPAKYALWAFAVVAMIFVPGAPLFSDVYLWIARGM